MVVRSTDRELDMKKDIRYDWLIFQQLRVVQFYPFYFGVLIPQRSAINSPRCCVPGS